MIPPRVLVTGHARGLGVGLVQALLARGADVLAISRGGVDPVLGLRQVSLDLSDTSATAEWIADGGLADFLAGAGQAMLVNNAGTVAPIGPAGTQGAGPVARAVTLNIAAPMMLADAFVAATEATPDRRILHISSGAGRKVYPGWSVYCATKAALDMHAQAVAADALAGLRIESLAPGVIDTDMQAEIRGTPDDKFSLRADFEAMKRDGALVDATTRGAQIIAHLCSDSFGRAIVTNIRDLIPA